MELGPIYHPGPVARYCILAMIVFPFASIALLKWKPQIRLGYFFLPMILGAFLLCFTIYDTKLALALYGRPSKVVMAAGIAEGIFGLFFGAGSTFATALFQIRSRRRGLGWVMAVSAVVMIACWATANHFIRIARTGG